MSLYEIVDLSEGRWNPQARYGVSSAAKGLGEVDSGAVQISGGVAKALPGHALAQAVADYFVTFQKVLNRYSRAAVFPPLVIDGALGSKTLDAVKQVAKFIILREGGAVSQEIRDLRYAPDVSAFAYKADRLGALFDGYANALGLPTLIGGTSSGTAPPSASASSASAMPSVDPTTATSVRGSMFTGRNVAVAVGFGLLFLLFLGGGRKRG